MKSWYRRATLISAALIGVVALAWFVLDRRSPAPAVPGTATPGPTEHPLVEIPLSGPIAAANAEVSGMAWYGDVLILLPQYPGRMADRDDGAVFALPRADIVAFLDGDVDGPLEPVAVPLLAPGLAEGIQDFEGYEAIAFAGERAYLTIEASPGASMQGYLVTGAITPDVSALRLDPESLVEIDPQAGLSNMSDEALFTVGDVVVTIYEANGANVNPEPVAHRFDAALGVLEAVAFPNVEYRITDATALDADGTFWAINYFWPGDVKLDPAADPLVAAFGVGATHAQSETVERLVAFRYDTAGIALVDAPPIQLELAGEARNWEGVVRLDERGFLLVTDKFPQTILGFVGR
ncbi:MAG: hypothetical protein JXD18_15255 [Anaerolineae bacterium]|nr:hypothetical protein [Anaerolineae bacterium]